MIPFLLVLLLTGPYRPLAPLEEGDPSLVIQSINDILEDRWLELPASRPESCDGPCTEILAAAPSFACGDLKERVAKAKAGWRDVREAALALGAALDQPFPEQQAAYTRLAQTMQATRAVLTDAELRRDFLLERSWLLKPETLLPGVPSEWRQSGSAFRLERKTGGILAGRDVALEVRSEGSAVKVTAKYLVAPVEYCAGDVSFRIEGAVVFQFEAAVRTSVALLGNGAATPDQSVSYPGDR